MCKLSLVIISKFNRDRYLFNYLSCNYIQFLHHIKIHPFSFCPSLHLMLQKNLSLNSEVASWEGGLSHHHFSIKVQTRQVQIQLCWLSCTQSLRHVISHLFCCDILIWQSSQHSYLNTASRIIVSKLIYNSPNLISVNSAHFLGVSVK